MTESEALRRKEILLDSGLFREVNYMFFTLIGTDFHFSIRSRIWWESKSIVVFTTETILEKIQDPDIKLSLLFYLDLLQ